MLSALCSNITSELLNDLNHLKSYLTNKSYSACKLNIVSSPILVQDILLFIFIREAGTSISAERKHSDSNWDMRQGCDIEKIHPLKCSLRSNHLIIRVTQSKVLLQRLLTVIMLGLNLALIQSRKLLKKITCQTDFTEEQRTSSPVWSWAASSQHHYAKKCHVMWVQGQAGMVNVMMKMTMMLVVVQQMTNYMHGSINLLH